MLFQKKPTGRDFNQNDHKIKPRPRKNRKAVLAVILITVIVPAYLYFKSQLVNLWHGLYEAEEYQFVKPLSNKLEKESSYVIPVDIKSIDDLTNYIKDSIAGLQGQYGVYFLSLSSGEEVNIHSDELFDAASVVKIIPMTYFYQEVEGGRQDLNATYLLKKDDVQDYGTGSIQYERSGKEYTYEKLLDLAGKESDNTAYHVIRQKLGASKIDDYVIDHGLVKTELKSVASTPREVGFFFKLIYDGLLTQKNQNRLYDNLTDTEFEKRIPAGIPDKIRVVHKVGNGFSRSYNDCGIIFSPRPFVLCVMNEDAKEEEAMTVIPIIAQAAYKWSVGQ